MSLRTIEEALADDSTDKLEQAMAAFLQVSFRLTRDAVVDGWSRLDRAALETIRDDETDESEAADQLRQLLWNGDELSPFAQRLLLWEEGNLIEAEAPLPINDLNNYLGASVDFYEGLRLASVGDIEVPDLNLIQPARPPSLELPDVLEILVSEEPAPRLELVLEASLEPLPVTPVTEEAEVALQLLWEAPRDAFAAESGDHPNLLVGDIDDDADEDAPEAEESAEGLFPEIEQEVEFDQGPPLAVELPVQPTHPASPPRVAKVAAKPARLVDDDGMEVMEMSAAPLSPGEQKSQLIVKKKYLGYGKNSDGVMGYCGQLTLSRFDDASLSARLQCSNPLLFLSSAVPSGKSPVVTYWMPPAAFPQPGGHLTISTSEQNKVLSVGSLFPQSRTDFLKTGQVLLLLLAPTILGLMYFSFVYLISISGIIEQVRSMFPEAYAAASAGTTGIDFRSQGVGIYQLEVVPAAESLQLIWAALIWLCPLIASKFYRHLSRSRQRSFGGAMAAALILPTLGMLGVWNVQKRLFPILDHPDFSPLDLRHFLTWSAPLNLAIAFYLFLSVHGVWDRRVTSRELRLLLPVLLAAAYLVLTFLLIFGRSWLGV